MFLKIVCLVCHVCSIINITNSAMVYFINLPNNDINENLFDNTQESILETNYVALPKSQEEVFLDTLIKYYGNIKKEVTPLKKKCDRRFGSIYGIKEQKLRCLHRNRKKRSFRNPNMHGYYRQVYKTQLKNARANFSPKNWQPDPIDIVNADRLFSLDYFDVKDLSRSGNILRKPDFSNDYLDVNDLRTGRAGDHIDLNLDLNLNVNTIPPSARKSNDQKSRASSDSSESDYDIDFEKKPKRFQVKHGEDSSLESKSSTGSSEEGNKHDSSGGTFQKKNENSDTSYPDTSNENKQVVKTAKENKNGGKIRDNKNNLVYMQSLNRLTDDNGRRRLQHFMPKRFHWEEDEFDKLGYFWFNGHRGKYAEPSRIY